MRPTRQVARLSERAATLEGFVATEDRGRLNCRVMYQPSVLASRRRFERSKAGIPIPAVVPAPVSAVNCYLDARKVAGCPIHLLLQPRYLAQAVCMACVPRPPV